MLYTCFMRLIRMPKAVCLLFLAHFLREISLLFPRRPPTCFVVTLAPGRTPNFLHFFMWVCGLLPGSPQITGRRCASLFQQTRTGIISPQAAASSLLDLVEVDLKVSSGVDWQPAAGLATSLTRGIGPNVLRLLLFLAFTALSRLGALMAPKQYADQESFPIHDEECDVLDDDGDADVLIQKCSRRALWESNMDPTGGVSVDGVEEIFDHAAYRDVVKSTPAYLSPDGSFDALLQAPAASLWVREAERVRPRLVSADRVIKQRFFQRSAVTDVADVQAASAVSERWWRDHLMIVSVQRQHSS